MDKLPKDKAKSIQTLLIKKLRETIGIDTLKRRVTSLCPNAWPNYEKFFLSNRSLKLKVKFVLWLNQLSDNSLKDFVSCEDSFKCFRLNGARRLRTYEYKG